MECFQSILSNLDNLPLKLANKIKNNTEQLKLSKELTTLVKHIPLKFDLKRLKTKASDKDKLISIFKELEFKQLIKNLGKDSLNKREEAKVIISKDANKLIDKISSTCWIIHLETKTSGWQIDLSPCKEKIIFQLILATVLGALIGLERGIKRKEAGLQTYSLVTLGTCLFTIISFELFNVFFEKTGISFDP